jgi:hypothetical protein
MDNGYFSHVPILAASMLLTSGPVLELGAGYGSTPMLHGLCGVMGRELTTLESDEGWLESFKHFAREWHSLRFVSSFTGLPEYSNYYGLVFVDHGISLQRGSSVEALQNVPIIVCHDTCHAWLYNYEPLLSTFKYRFNYKQKGPQTSVVSNLIDVNKQLTRGGI